MRLFQPTKLHHIILLRLGLVLFGGALLFGLGALLVLERTFANFERSQLQRQLDMVNSLMAAEASNLYGSVVTYGQWDDTFQFIRQPDERYPQSNYTVDALKPIFVDLVAIFDRQCRPLYSGWLADRQARQLQRAPADLLDSLCRRARARNMQHPADAVTYWSSFQGTPLLVGMAPVTDSLDTLPSNGTLVMARLMSAAYMERLHGLTRVDFSIVPRTRTQTLISALPDGTLGETPLAGSASDQQHWALRSYSAEQTSAQRRAGTLLVAATAVLLFLLALGAVWWNLDRLVLRRLARFEALSSERRRTGNADIRWPVDGTDELDSLGESLNELLQEVSVAQQRLTHDATHDTLTGLGNRSLLAERMEFVMSLRERNPELGLFLLQVDIDSFKMINDTVGHVIGDRVLVELAQRLQDGMRSCDTIVRLGGDEFALIGIGVTDPAAALLVAERLREALEQPVVIDSHTLPVSVSMGLVCSPERISFHEWLRRADIAIFASKQAGKGRITAFSPQLDERWMEKNTLLIALRQALAERRFKVWFQPIVDGDDGRISAMEALIRWQHEGQWISPARFIPLAEDHGLINPLGSFVLEQSCAALARLRRLQPELTCNINVSVHQIVETDLVSEVLACIAAHGLPPSAIHLELTETVLAQNEEMMAPTMRRLLEAGVHFHLDDFGTGYSSLQRLNRLPINTLKLDRSFVHDLGQGNGTIARVIYMLAQELNLDLVAEGVENDVERQALLALGYRLMQGFYFAKPMPEEDLVKRLQLG